MTDFRDISLISFSQLAFEPLFLLPTKWLELVQVLGNPPFIIFVPYVSGQMWKIVVLTGLNL